MSIRRNILIGTIVHLNPDNKSGFIKTYSKKNKKQYSNKILNLEDIEKCWISKYFNYEKIKNILDNLIINDSDESFTTCTKFNINKLVSKKISISVAKQSGGSSNKITYTFTEFYENFNNELQRVEEFIKDEIIDINETIDYINKNININLLKRQLELIGYEFLKLEKYINVNHVLICSIIKLYNLKNPTSCEINKISHDYNKNWKGSDCSNIFVKISNLYNTLRTMTHENKSVHKHSAHQNFIRSTTKYWIDIENVSTVKYFILQHLPILLQKNMSGETDSQLTNSIYFDNESMELYHSRLRKEFSAKALRFRWYGDGDPDIVFIERKRRKIDENDESVKERFSVSPDQVSDFMNGKFSIKKEMDKMKIINPSISKKELNNFCKLAKDVKMLINDKDVKPVLQTQCTRTSFQDSSTSDIRISIDTNLCMMIKDERTTLNKEKWHITTLPENSDKYITKVPYAILELKLQIDNKDDIPVWVNDLLESGLFHKFEHFSKYIHGCSMLIQDKVKELPYWLDRTMLNYSGGKHITFTNETKIHPDWIYFNVNSNSEAIDLKIGDDVSYTIRYNTIRQEMVANIILNQ